MVDALGYEYSLVKQLEEKTGIPCKIIFTELEHPKSFPYIYIRNVPSNHEVLSKGRETIESTYEFELILYNNSQIEMSKNRSKVMRALMFDKFKYYNSDAEETNRTFEIESGVFESPTIVNTAEYVSSYFQVSYDFQIVATHHKN